ncbi:hypothetical protein [Shinella sp.]|jgi:hypothetical protein|uniref:hypothetical protein n=1 Tax=Shinella sp. TaxID=1870904 RepID=UPI003F713D48
MTPRALMIFGALLGIFGVALAIVRPDAGGFSVFLFAAGAVFGKGYGIYDERTRGPLRRGELLARQFMIALEKIAIEEDAVKAQEIACIALTTRPNPVERGR